MFLTHFSKMKSTCENALDMLIRSPNLLRTINYWTLAYLHKPKNKGEIHLDY